MIVNFIGIILMPIIAGGLIGCAAWQIATGSSPSSIAVSVGCAAYITILALTYKDTT